MATPQPAASCANLRPRSSSAAFCAGPDAAQSPCAAKLRRKGRGLTYDFEQLKFSECWWGKKCVSAWSAHSPRPARASLLEAFDPQRALALALHARILELDARLAALLNATLTVPLPHSFPNSITSPMRSLLILSEMGSDEAKLRCATDLAITTQ